MGEKEWYFFSLRDRKYPTGVRTNRATNAGYWKTTGKDKEIFSNSNSRMSSSHLLGMKKTLVFYRGRAPRGEKSNWVMHEYRVHSRSSLRTPKDEWVVCRVFQKNDIGKKYSTETSRESQYNLEVNNTSLLSQHPTTKTVNCDGSYITITDFTGVTSNGGMRNDDSTQNVNFSLFSPSKNFTISGLNLNLGRGVSVPLLQNYYAPVQQVHQDDAIFAAEAVNYAEQQEDDGDGREMTEQCLDLDAYWPTY